MSVAKVIEITAESPTSFEAAVAAGVAEAHKTLKNLRTAWVKDQEVVVKDGRIERYRVALKVTFVLSDD